MGLPSVVSHWLFGLVASLLIVAFLLPAIVHILARIRKREPAKMPLSLRNRCLSVLIAYVMLIGPGFEQLSHASTTYSALVPDDWAKAGNSVVYTYDDIGRLTNKDTSGVETETVTYEYNNLDRLAKIITSRGDTVEVVEYAYNPDGIRVKSQFTRTINSLTDEVRTTTYLVDSFNHTGYAQTIEEHKETTDYIGGVPQTPETTDTIYTLGDDVISQYESSVGADHLLYDGHGSTRQLTDDDTTNVVVDCFGYDAYGVMLGGNPNHSAPAATSLLYAGEQFDTDAQQYYLRARYYDQNTGRFNRMDPFAGSNQDPQSLHKYLYCHANPVNGIDPSGKMGLIGKMVICSIIATLLSILILPQMWTRLGSYGIKKAGKNPKNIAVINSKLGFKREWLYGWEGVNINEFSSELTAAGHNVTYSVLPNEEEFIQILNSNEIVVLVAHGLEIYDRVATGTMMDKNKATFAGVILGGTSSHKDDDPIKDSVTDYSVKPKDEWITANELNGRVTNSNLELIAISCQLGKTKRFAQAISPGAFVGSKINLGGPEYRDMLDYATQRANGIERSIAFKNLQKNGTHYVSYP